MSMKYHACYFNWKRFCELACIIGFVIGRVSYAPQAKYIYSFRIYFLFLSFEINWTTGEIT